MTNYQKLTSMRKQLDKMWEELIVMDTSKDPVATLHKEDANSLFCKLIILIGCMTDFENQ